MTKQSGLLINETLKIPERDRRRIERSLHKRLCKGVDLAAVLAEIESAIQNYSAEIKAEQQRQKLSEIKRQLSPVAKSAATFPEGAAELCAALENLGPDASEALEQLWQRRAKPYLSLNEIHNRIYTFEETDDLRESVRQLRCAALDFQPRRRPRQEAAGVLINWLALTYERATGTWPGRAWDAYYGYKGHDRHPYFEACFRAAGLSAKDSKKKLAMVRPILEAGKAQRTQRTKIAKQSRQSRH